jgi:hypothetical protein
MTKRIASLIGLALLAVVSASAQITNRVEVTVPFSFVAAGTTWAAGTYKLDLKPGTGLVMIQSQDSGSRFLMTQGGQFPDNGNMRVRFQRYGNQWLLRAILGAGMQADVLPGKFERELMSRKSAESRTVLAHLER